MGVEDFDGPPSARDEYKLEFANTIEDQLQYKPPFLLVLILGRKHLWVAVVLHLPLQLHQLPTSFVPQTQALDLPSQLELLASKLTLY